MTVLRSRVIPPVAAEPSPKKPKRSAEIDPSTPPSAPDEVVGTPPSPSLAPSPDARAPRSGPSLPLPRRSLRLASGARSGGAFEGPLPPPPAPYGSCPSKDEGAGEGSLTAEDAKAMKLGVGWSGRSGRGKKKPGVDATLVDSPGLMSLRSGKSDAKRVGDSGAARGFAESSVIAFEVGGNDAVVLGRVVGEAASKVENKEKGSGSPLVGSPGSRMTLRSAEKGKGKADEHKIIDLVPRASGAESGSTRGKVKYSAVEKGKGKMVKDDNMRSDNIDIIDLELGLKQLGQKLESYGRELENMRSDDSTRATDNAAKQVQTRSKRAREKVGESSSVDIRGRFRDIARQNASRFAHFHPDDEVANDLPGEAARNVNEVPREATPEPENWPGPFSTAMKIIRDRAAKMSSQQSSSTLNKSKSAITWVPNGEGRTRTKRFVPSLLELCLKVLAANADAITSLDGVPDLQRHKLSQLLCDSRKMNKQFFDLLVGGSPTEIRVKDSSWLTEEDLTDSFRQCDATNLTVLQLDQCGRCLPDYIISSSISRSANCCPVLSTVSITGACRLTDGGLTTLISSAPALRSINLSQCSLLTNGSIETLANHLGSSLRELYLNDCQSIDAMLMLPALKKLEHLQVLSVGGISSLSDDFVREFIALRGHGIRELVLSDCTNLTDASVKAIADTCPGLLALNLVNLTNLTDSTVGYLANGCQAIEKLILCRNNFSDEAIAAFLETSGEHLQELSLNNIKKVGPNTAISIAKGARKLRSLDLSWCRNMADEALGLIVDSCSCLRELRVFGCTQISDAFLNGHSNEEVQIIGLKMAPILGHCRVSLPQNPLKYS
ncbi:hypothetical protein CDL15_Pgr013323 [Punica granatum]|uniref:Uncharacterized protein n=1 Tax=Punica granatum TaxID=22663 RepID=A0A218WPL0_PUNGR|nr:hypothetical protein CDL15_Pgr013323 [Punica granatum]